jgi:hypothetical protein
MALALVGIGLGALAHYSSKAMDAPVPPQNFQYFNVPINVRATNAMANPGQAPTQSYNTGISTEPNYTPAGRDQDQLLDNMALQLSSNQQHYQQKMLQYWMNAGDNVVLPNANELVPILTNDLEVYSTAYVGRNNLKSVNAAGRLVRTGELPTVGPSGRAARFAPAPAAPAAGTIMGAANWAV